MPRTANTPASSWPRLLPLACLFPASNLITATAVSREGRNIYINQYLPVKYQTQIMAKVISGMIMGLVGMIMMVTVASFFVNWSAHLWLMLSAVSILGIVFSSLSGMILDLNYPKLLWDDETKAVKQNMNGVINIFLCAAIAGITVYLVVALQPPIMGRFCRTADHLWPVGRFAVLAPCDQRRPAVPGN